MQVVAAGDVMSREAAEEVDLKVGTLATAVVKATNVTVEAFR